MIAYEVRVNGKKVTTAGLRKGGVVSLIANWVSHPPDGKWADGGEWEAGFRVGGLQEGKRGLDEYLTWFRKDLRVGDEISFRLVEVSCANKPKQIERKRKKRK
jgi:hypothetical protein